MRSDLTLLPVGHAPAAGLTDALTSAAGYAHKPKRPTRPAAPPLPTFAVSRPGARPWARSRCWRRRRPLRPLWRRSPIRACSSLPASSAGKRTRAPSIAVTLPSFWACCGARTSPARSPRGRAGQCSRSWHSSPTKCDRCPLTMPRPDAAQGQADAGRGLRPSPARLVARAPAPAGERSPRRIRAVRRHDADGGDAPGS